MPGQEDLTLLPDFVRKLTIAWKNLGSYPTGHPALEGAIDSVQQRLSPLTASTGELLLGVARDGLMFGEQKFDFAQAQKFAQAVYLRDVALVRFERGVANWEMEFFLHALSVEPSKADQPLWVEMSEAGVEHIQLQPVDYSSVRATSDLDQPPAVPREPRSLWEEILTALLSGKELSALGDHVLTSDGIGAGELARLISQYLYGPAADGGGGGVAADSFSDPDDSGARRIRGGLIGGMEDTISRRMKTTRATALPAATAVAAAVSNYLARADAGGKQVAAHQVAELLRSLPVEMRDAVLAAAVRALASEESAGEALQTLCKSLPADAILQALRRLKSEGVSLSAHAMRLAQALSAVSRSSGIDGAPEIATLVQDLLVLMQDNDIDRFNPEEHETLLGEVALQFPQVAAETEFSGKELAVRLDSCAEGVITENAGSTVLALVSKYGSQFPIDGALRRLENVFLFYLRTSQIEPALSIIETLQQFAQGLSATASQHASLQAFFGRLINDESISSLLEHQLSNQGSPALRKLVSSLGAAASKNFLVALAKEENRSRRRKLFDLLASLGTVIVPGARKLLADDRWYVVRNMIILLRTVGDRSSVADVRQCAYHPDLRVRFEAIKSLLATDPQVPADLLQKAINDPDPKLAEAAVVLVGNYGIKEGVGPLLAILNKWDLFGSRRSLRLKSLRALSELADPAALPKLDHFFRDWIVPVVSTEERRAAFKFLESYPASDRRGLLERGLRSRDQQIREICIRLSRSEPSAPVAADETVRGGA